MNQGEFDRVAAAFAAFHREFAPLFGRTEAQRRSEQYVRGLLVQQTECHLNYLNLVRWLCIFGGALKGCVNGEGGVLSS